MINKKKMQFYIENNYNVLFIGKHGVGKTSLIKQAFNDAGLNWRYFSASTMDPWVDFVGVPKEANDGNISYIDLIRPKDFAEDKIEALFFDEYNRSKEKIRNAIMELIQFKSINGKKFNNLRIVWAAINPPDEDGEEFGYDVEKIDPAQLDRFQIHIEIPYKPSYEYFAKTYGSKMAKSAISWWNGQNNNVKDLISPRRLDYVLDVYKNNGDISDVIGKKVSSNSLIRSLSVGPIKERLKTIYKNDNSDEIRKFFENENNYSEAISFVLKKDDYIHKFVPLFPKEKISLLFAKSEKIQNFIISNEGEFPVFDEVISEIEKSSTNKTLANKINRLRQDVKVNNMNQYNNRIRYFNVTSSNTNDRKNIYRFIRDNVKKVYSLDEKGTSSIKSIEILINIARHSQTSSIKTHYSELEKICNDLIDFSIEKNNGKIPPKIKKLKNTIIDLNNKHSMNIGVKNGKLCIQ